MRRGGYGVHRRFAEVTKYTEEALMRSSRGGYGRACINYNNNSITLL